MASTDPKRNREKVQGPIPFTLQSQSPSSVPAGRASRWSRSAREEAETLRGDLSDTVRDLQGGGWQSIVSVRDAGSLHLLVRADEPLVDTDRRRAGLGTLITMNFRPW